MRLQKPDAMVIVPNPALPKPYGRLGREVARRKSRMKFVCERCHTKYSIADDKVRQKILKIRCKTCENVITIRDAVVVNEPRAVSEPSGVRAVRLRLRAARAACRSSGTWRSTAARRARWACRRWCTRISGGGSRRRDLRLERAPRRLEGTEDRCPRSPPSCARAAAAGTPPLPPGARRAARRPAAGRRAHLPPARWHRRAAPRRCRRSGVEPVRRGRRGWRRRRRGRRLRAISEQEELTARRPRSRRSTRRCWRSERGASGTPARARHAAVPASFPALADLVGQPAGCPVSSAVERLVGAGRCRHRSSGLEGSGLRPRCPWRRQPRAPRRPAAAVARGARGVVAAPVVGGSTSMLLSQIGGRVARARHPAIKYVVTGGRAGRPDHRRRGAVHDRRRARSWASLAGGGSHRPGRRRPIPRRRPGPRPRSTSRAWWARSPRRPRRHHVQERRPASVPPPQPARPRARQEPGQHQRRPRWRRRRSAAGPRPPDGGGVARGSARTSARWPRPARTAAAAARCPRPASTTRSSWACSSSRTTTPPSRAATSGRSSATPKLKLGRLDITVNVGETGLGQARCGSTPRPSSARSRAASATRSAAGASRPTREEYEADASR